MQTETKKVYLNWSEKGASYLNVMYTYDMMLTVDQALKKCDELLGEVELGISYTSRKDDIERLLEGHGTLRTYIDALNYYVDEKLDQPLCKDFKKNATETISRIHLEDFEVDNTLGLTETYTIPGNDLSPGTSGEREKDKLSFADFMGTSAGKPGIDGICLTSTNGCVEDFANIFAGQYEAMLASGMLGEDNEMTQQEFLEQFYKQGEFTHDSSNPFLNFVSSVLDITIIKPIIEACTGEDLITGEDLTDLERGLKVVFAVVDLVTLGGAIAATKFSELGLKEGLKFFGKTVAIEFAGNTAACGVSALGEAFDWPVPVTIMLSLAAGITVSISGNRLLFKNADGIEIGSKVLDDDALKIVGETIGDGDSSFASKELATALKEQGLTLDEFNKLRLTNVNDLTNEQIAQLKAIREAVPKIDANTYIQKTIPASDIEKYLGDDGWSAIGGYVARYDDVSHIKGYDDVVESSRLDYVTGDGVRPYPEGGDTYGYIKFTTEQTDKISIPYGEKFGGMNTDGPPCTLNGFTAARNGEVVPEWTLDTRITPNEGAELHKVVNGQDVIVAIFDGEHFVKVKGE